MILESKSKTSLWKIAHLITDLVSTHGNELGKVDHFIEEIHVPIDPGQMNSIYFNLQRIQ